MKRSIIVLVLSLTLLGSAEAQISFGYQDFSGFTKPMNQASSLTDVFEYNSDFSKKYVFHFTGNPLCGYVPKAIDEKDVQAGKPVNLTFFVPQGTIKNGVSKKAIDSLNKAECKPDYCLKVAHVDKPIKGLEYRITLLPGKRGMEYRSYPSVTGKKGFMFIFHDQEALKKVNTQSSLNRILRLAKADKPKKKVVIDYAHGGRDPGFIKGKLKEKDINFSIGQEVTSLLKKKGYEVCLTRSGDESLTLTERVRLANNCKGAAALVSIHSNAAVNSAAVSGIETYCHKGDLFKTHYSKIQANTLDRAQEIDKNIYDGSRVLAKAIHSQVLGHAKNRNAQVVDRKVKYKVAQLLLGSDVPSVLVELGFLTNKREGKLLQSKSYQKDLAKGICKGLDEFFNVM